MTVPFIGLGKPAVVERLDQFNEFQRI